MLRIWLKLDVKILGKPDFVLTIQLFSIVDNVIEESGEFGDPTFID